MTSTEVVPPKCIADRIELHVRMIMDDLHYNETKRKVTMEVYKDVRGEDWIMGKSPMGIAAGIAYTGEIMYHSIMNRIHGGSYYYSEAVDFVTQKDISNCLGRKHTNFVRVNHERIRYHMINTGQITFEKICKAVGAPV